MKRSVTLLLLAAAVCLAAAYAGGAGATEYYVDSFAGSDENPGDSPERPWQTLTRVNSAKVGPGDAVLFRRGRVWRGSLRTKAGAPESPLRYGAYGEGEKPRIMSSADLSDPGFWSLVDSERQIWATPPTRYYDVADEAVKIDDFAPGSWHVYTEDAAKGRASAQVFEDLGGAQGYHVVCERGGEKSSYFQLTTENFPVRADRFVAMHMRVRSTKPFTLSNSVSKLMMRGKPWSSYGDSVVAIGGVGGEWREADLVFHTTANAEDGRITFFLGGVIPDDSAFDFVIDSVSEVEFPDYDLGADVGNLIFTPAGVVDQASDPALKRFAPSWDRRETCGFKRWTLEDVKADGDFWYDVDSRRVFLKTPENPGSAYASVEAVLRPHCCLAGGDDAIIENIAFTHTGAHGISLPKRNRVIVRDCDFDWIGGGDLGGGGGAGKRVRFGNGVEFWDGSVDCSVERCRFARVYDTATTTQGPEKDVSKNLVIRDCVMYRCEQAFEIWFTHEETTLEGCVFERNLCVDCGRDWSHIQRPNKIATPILGYNLTAKTVDVTIRENVFYDSAEFFIKVWHDRIGEYHIDNNVYWTCADRNYEQGDRFFAFNASKKLEQYSYDEYRKATGHDEHSRWLEPKFRDYGKDDFTLLNRAELGAGPKDDSKR